MTFSDPRYLPEKKESYTHAKTFTDRCTDTLRATAQLGNNPNVNEQGNEHRIVTEQNTLPQ